ncbi:MAG: hypothetical protein ACKOYJ_04750 [Planctomycetia bacterium]
MRPTVIRMLVLSIVASLLLPIVIAVVVGLASLLAALGDDAAALVCRRTALAVGVLWFVSVVVTAVASGVVAVDSIGRDPAHDEKPDARS